jgi:hypothetical protein
LFLDIFQFLIILYNPFPTFIREVFKPKPGLVDGSLDFLGAMKPLEEVPDECRIPIEKSEADILMIAGEDDHNFESVQWAEAAWWVLSYLKLLKFKAQNICQNLPWDGSCSGRPFCPSRHHNPTHDGTQGDESISGRR